MGTETTSVDASIEEEVAHAVGIQNRAFEDNPSIVLGLLLYFMAGFGISLDCQEEMSAVIKFTREMISMGLWGQMWRYFQLGTDVNTCATSFRILRDLLGYNIAKI